MSTHTQTPTHTHTLKPLVSQCVHGWDINQLTSKLQKVEIGQSVSQSRSLKAVKHVYLSSPIELPIMCRLLHDGELNFDQIDADIFVLCVCLCVCSCYRMSIQNVFSQQNEKI